MKKHRITILALACMTLVPTGELYAHIKGNDKDNNASLASNKYILEGNVEDAENQPICGATVKLHNGKGIAVTDVKGHYSLEVAPDDEIEVSYLGYTTSQQKVKGKRHIDVTLQDDVHYLDETVCVAYGVQSKRNLTSAVGNLDVDRVKDVPVNSADQLLQGRVSGIAVTTTSAGVNESPVIRVRGVSSITSGNQPLYIIDGIAIDNSTTAGQGRNNTLGDINPADILSIDVLKDAAAAALYGSRAANGVILITTRQGQNGKTKVSYNGSLGFSVKANTIKRINAAQYVDIKNESVRNRYGTDEYNLTENAPTTDGTKAFNLWYKDDGSYYDTDWDKEVYQTGIQHNHTVSLSGGNEKTKFYLSGNYANQKGIVKGDRYHRFGLNASGSATANKWLRIGGSVNTTQTSTKVVDGSRVAFGAGSSDGFPRLAVILPSSFPAWNEDGTPYIGEGGYMGTYPNTVLNNWPSPAAHLYYGTHDRINVLRMIATTWAELKPVDGLTLKTQYGIDYSHTDDEFFLCPQVTGDKKDGQAINNSTRSNKQTWTNTAGYLHSFGNHNIDITLGEETVTGQLNRWGAQRNVLLDTKFRGFNGSWSSTTANNGKDNENKLISFFGRFNYDFASRYLLSLNIRRDGYSALSKDHRWGTFGGVSAAWRLSDEKFWEPLKKDINEFKLKASWGVVGNTNIDDYAAWSYYTTNYYAGEAGYTIGQIADSENLKWESSTKVDFGFSAIIRNNVTIDFDYYHNASDDLILSVPTTVSKGIPGNSITANAGKMTNQGIELTIGADIIRKKDFLWHTSFNISTLHNKVTALANGVDNIVSGQYNITRVGGSIGELYLYPTNGVDKETGRRIFLDKNNREVLYYYEKSNKWIYKDDGSVAKETDITRRSYGNTLPKYYGGWSNNLRWRNLELNLFFQFSGGNKIYDATKAMEGNYTFWSNSKECYNNYWKQDRTDAKYSIPIYGDNYSNGYSKGISQWVEKGDYLRLKDIELAYNFNTSKWKSGISALRLYVQAQNLFTITGYDGVDPEVNTNYQQSSDLQAGIDKHVAPHARTYTIGINVTF